MITKIEKFDLLLGNKKNPGKTYLYSQIIRNERTRRKMTLSEMAHGICSISYLCKFEKNAINVDEDYIKAIFERVNLDYTKVGMNIIEEGVRNVVKAYLYDKFEEIERYFLMIDDSIFNVQNCLIKGFYYLVNEKYMEFKEIVKTIDNIKDTLLLEDVGVFMFLVVQYYVNTNQFREAEKYLKYLDKLTFEMKEISWLIYEQHFVTGYNLKCSAMVFKYYRKLMSNFNIGYPSQRQLIIRLMLLDIESEEYFEEVEKEIQNLNLAQMDDRLSSEAWAWKLRILLRGNKWFDVFDEIVDNHLYFDARFAALLLYTVDTIDDDNYRRQAVELIKDQIFDEKETIHTKFIKFMLIKFTSEKKYALVEYLKYEALPYNALYSHPLYGEVYDRYYLEYLCHTSKYKEAFYYQTGLKTSIKQNCRVILSQGL